MCEKMNKFSEYLRYDLWRVMRPLAFHGAGKSGPFFEGWYYKLISMDGTQRLSIIPGVYIGKDHRDDHAFIQLIDGVSGHSDFYPYAYADFSFEPGEMDVRVAKSHFTQDFISLGIDREDLNLAGKVHFLDQKPWPITLFSPGVMGWYAWVPGMECYHGIVSMDHALSGKLILNGKELNFSGGRGYMEKDWGRAMPSAWIWMQCNHFSQPGTSLTFSIADIPWGRQSFAGFLGGFLLNGQLHRFATYTGAHLSPIQVSEKTVHFTVQDRNYRLKIIAVRQEGAALQAPTTRQMDRRIIESLSAEINIRFSTYENGKWKEIYSDRGQHAGLEVVDDLSMINMHDEADKSSI